VTAEQEKKMDMGTQQVRRLIRRTDDKMVAGVAAGLGDYFGIDPVWFRLGFVLTAFMGGVGLLAYIVMWVIMPSSAGSAPSGAERGLERAARAMRATPAWIGVGLVVLGGILVINAAVEWRPGVIWGFALIVFGVLFFVQRDERRVSSPGPAGTEVLEPPSSGGPLLPPAIPGGTPPPLAPPGSVADMADMSGVSGVSGVSANIRQRSTLGFMTFGTLLLTIGTLSLLDAQGVIALRPGQYLAAALGVIGLGLLVGSVVGRARWLIVPGLMLVPFVLVASLIHVPFEGGFGERVYRLTGAAAPVTTYHLIAGDMTIDLRGVVPSGPYKIEATTVAGHILIIVPAGSSLDIEAKAGAGEIDLFGQRYDGVNVDVHRMYPAEAPGTGVPAPATIEVDVEAGLGQVEVRS
jgi:phage shock protein PspC (stress-responsive transcriptional regulator)